MTMITPQELAKPRYKVIADYPSNIHKIGSIIQNNDGEPIDRIAYYECAKFPHLFKPLQWWEERELPQMPQYVKDKFEQFWEVELWEKVVHGEEMLATLKKANYCNAKKLIPATLAEYEAYTQTQK